MRSFHVFLFRTWLACSGLAGLATAASAAGSARPNVLFIAIDDLRDWVGFLGRNPQARTPNLDRLARMGMTFTHNYCAAPICNASRAALMTGLRPFSTGIYENNNDWRTVVSEDKPLTTAFRRAGYYVCGSGKIYHEAYPRRSEWDDYLANPGGLPKVPPGQSDGVGEIKFAALDCRDEDLNDWKITSYGITELGRPHDKPLFLAVGLNKPHMPWNVPKKYYDLFPLEDIQLPPYRADDLADVPPAGVRMANQHPDHAAILKSGRWKEAIQGYLAAIAYTDMNIGRLLDAFEKSAYKDNTIICLWSDHGWHLGEKLHWRKHALWEEATRSPLIWVVPGLTAPGSVCDRTTDFMSVYPTLMDLCGIPTPSHVEGESVRALLTNPQAPWDRPAVSTYRFKNHAVRSADWRYIRYENGDEELYRDAEDPNEWTNLAAQPGYAAQLAEMRAFLPTHDHADIGGGRDQGAEDFGGKKTPGGKKKKTN